MSTEARTSDEPWDPKLGPRPLPRFHGKGCICHLYARKDCPAAATPYGQERDRIRKVNGLRLTIREANATIEKAEREKAEAETALKDMGELP